MLLRDRIMAQLAQRGEAADDPRIVAEVLGIRNASPEMARRILAQALVVESREAAWRRAGERLAAAAPDAPAVYVLRDAAGRPLYVGKAARLRRRLRQHFSARRWPALKADLARAAGADWQLVGSELEALVREAALIHELQPPVNVQVAPPSLDARRIPRALVRDVIVLAPSVEAACVELVCARADGPGLILRTARSGAELVTHTTRLMRFFHSPLWRARAHRAAASPSVDFAPIVFTWLAGRGSTATRLDPHDAGGRQELAGRLAALFADSRLFVERLDQR
jgi:predicted GIY-YIG superfamily endonuclease